MTDKTFAYTHPIQYHALAYHRGEPDEDKCVWTLSQNEEFDCFVAAYARGYIEGPLGWGYWRPNAVLVALGRNLFGEAIILAKFKGDRSCENYHGYPADYRRKRQDVPPINLLLDWYRGGALPKYAAARIRQGKKWNP